MVVLILSTQVFLSSCEEDSEIFDNADRYTDEHNVKKQKPN